MWRVFFVFRQIKLLVVMAVRDYSTWKITAVEVIIPMIATIAGTVGSLMAGLYVWLFFFWLLLAATLLGVQVFNFFKPLENRTKLQEAAYRQEVRLEMSRLRKKFPDLPNSELDKMAHEVIGLATADYYRSKR